MKTFKALVLTLFAVLLTGCYTQLQYTKSSKTSKPAKEQSAEGYSWAGNDQNKTPKNKNQQSVKVQDKYAKKYVSRIDCPSEVYQDENQQRAYSENCDTINNYYLNNPEFGNLGRYSYYNSPYSFYNGFGNFYSPWNQYGYYPHHYYGSSFNLSFSWGYPYSSYYGYGSYGYPYRYGYHNLYGQTYYDFYNGSQGVWYPKNSSSNESTRYGRRSIGTNRVNADRNRNRNRSVEGGRSAARNRRSNAVRNRSAGTSRTRNVTRNSNSRDVQQKSRNRGNGTIRSRGSSGSEVRSRSRSVRSSRGYNSEKLQRNARKQLKSLETVSNNNQNNRRSTFFNRVKGFFSRTANNIGTVDSHSTHRTRTRTRGSSSTINHYSGSSSSGNSRSKVGRSRSSSSSSSSSHTRSRSGSSPRSRSSGSDDGGSSSQRSRDN